MSTGFSSTIQRKVFMKHLGLMCFLSSLGLFFSQTSFAQSWDSCSGIIAETGSQVRMQTNFGWPWNVEVNVSSGKTDGPDQFWIDVTRSNGPSTREYVSEYVGAANPSLKLSINLANCSVHILSTACSGSAQFGKYVFPVNCEIDHDYTPAGGAPCHPGIPCH
jgi:hypothetical protein